MRKQVLCHEPRRQGYPEGGQTRRLSPIGSRDLAEVGNHFDVPLLKTDEVRTGKGLTHHRPAISMRGGKKVFHVTFQEKGRYDNKHMTSCSLLFHHLHGSHFQMGSLHISEILFDTSEVFLPCVESVFVGNSFRDIALDDRVPVQERFFNQGLFISGQSEGSPRIYRGYPAVHAETSDHYIAIPLCNQ